MASLLMYSSLVLVSILLISSTEAVEILVGGKPNSWKVPSSVSDSLNKWAGSTRFNIGDSLVWKFDAQKDSVLRVGREDYVNCNVTKPIAEYKNGSAKIEFDQSGPFYFVSGIKGNCERGQKLVVVVMSKFHNGIAPAPSPMGSALAPSSGSHSLNTAGSFLGVLLVLALFFCAYRRL
ncbi:hypothetical protein C5167_012272 [Papaver somniferum]|uniref:Phytocyanin domain-containing protein n=1 Tax=Papaver somniferum TaxID=3469 RepID=A0A4Y7IWY1_PAPSO|nr:early nodulin-like protein 3 [Papaver somniferum]RZC53403.1 hypothetical protein C5167_012272 [Papaver somniferum]